MNATKIDQRPKCSQCGGHNVDEIAWIKYREDGTAAIAKPRFPFEGPTGTWCHDCEDDVGLDYPYMVPADRNAMEAADRAREHGPELLKSLKRLYEEIEESMESDCDWAGYETRAMKLARLAIEKAEGRDKT